MKVGAVFVHMCYVSPRGSTAVITAKMVWLYQCEGACCVGPCTGAEDLWDWWSRCRLEAAPDQHVEFGVGASPI
ncbi:hypothetical protein ROHU_015316 [Labeo rohita]|uniref:Uncharacterized protein n=1 Tax=Labeo rohita TaxID=84645 RepID=A0A498NQQ4_LABRO|nr:hypothetical protein ROHU_015316 [Labeo rohita]